MGLQEDFTLASEKAKGLPKSTSNEDALILYKWYKQAMFGDVKGDRPGMFDLTGKAKYDAWASVKGKSKEHAMKAYIEHAKKLKVI